MCYDYQKGVRNAHKDQTMITNELKGLCHILEHLLDLAETEAKKGSSQLLTLELLMEPNGSLLECQAELTTLKKKLEPANRWKAMRKGLTWLLKEGDVRKTLDQLERCKMALNLALAADQM